MASERTLDGAQRAAQLTREVERLLGTLPSIHKKSTNFRAKRVHGLLIDNSTFDKSANAAWHAGVTRRKLAGAAAKVRYDGPNLFMDGQ